MSGSENMVRSCPISTPYRVKRSSKSSEYKEEKYSGSQEHDQVFSNQRSIAKILDLTIGSWRIDIDPTEFFRTSPKTLKVLKGEYLPILPGENCYSFDFRGLRHLIFPTDNYSKDMEFLEIEEAEKSRMKGSGESDHRTLSDIFSGRTTGASLGAMLSQDSLAFDEHFENPVVLDGYSVSNPASYFQILQFIHLQLISFLEIYPEYIEVFEYNCLEEFCLFPVTIMKGLTHYSLSLQRYCDS